VNIILQGTASADCPYSAVNGAAANIEVTDPNTIFFPDDNGGGVTLVNTGDNIYASSTSDETCGKSYIRTCPWRCGVETVGAHVAFFV
jgi:hypothetical protein